MPLLTRIPRTFGILSAALVASLLSVTTLAGPDPAGVPIRLQVDLTHAPLKRFHVHETLPVGPGPMRLVYPKWIPGEHSPSGPVNGLTGLLISVDGARLAWHRDLRDMYAVQMEVPAGARQLDIEFEYVQTSEDKYGAMASSTPAIALLEWNQVVLYPDGTRASMLPVQASVRVPAGWQFATALEVAERTPDGASFVATSLEQLVDSPLFAGQYVRVIDLATGGAPVRLDVFADDRAALEVKPEQEAEMRALVDQAVRLAGTRHYRHYDFLLAVSDSLRGGGLEHHQSSDDRLPSGYFTDPASHLSGAALMPHEYFHSWNGKFRRPQGLATPDYQQPMQGDLLWVYEGLTNYYGEVLAARSRARTPAQFRDLLALDAADQQAHTGRQWRPLQDTADAAQLVYEAGPWFRSWRRQADFYREGTLLWLDADAAIRRQSNGRRSLDDAVRAFHGQHPDAVEVLPYRLEDLEAALNSVAALDWHQRLRALLDRTSDTPPLQGLEAAGWRLAWSDEPSELQKARDKTFKVIDRRHDIGLAISSDPKDVVGSILDVVWGGAAFTAGLAPGMQLVAVNGQAFNAETLQHAIADAASDSAPIRLLVRDDDVYLTLPVDWHGGLRYPHLEAIPGQPDLLEAISTPLP